jgi:hypothetical protein
MVCPSSSSRGDCVVSSLQLAQAKFVALTSPRFFANKPTSNSPTIAAFFAAAKFRWLAEP